VYFLIAVLFATRPAFAMQDVTDLVFGSSSAGPSDYAGLAQQAYYKMASGNLRGAAEELTQAINAARTVIKSRPDLMSDLFADRAEVWNRGHQPEAALKDCVTAIKLYPKNAEPYRQSYYAFLQLHQYRRALEATEAAARVTHRYPATYLNNAAWVMATCPDSQVRNGKQAVAEATHACEINRWKNWSFVDTLAAAYAEAGDFGQAMANQQRAISIAGAFEKKKDAMERRLALYSAHKPYRDETLGE
jgi:tetratricopeptide (TPR) repeat protein